MGTTDVSCPDCRRAAKVWHWGAYSSDCTACMVREVAKCPPMIREAEYLLCPADDRAEFVAQVNAERRRIRALQEAEPERTAHEP